MSDDEHPQPEDDIELTGDPDLTELLNSGQETGQESESAVDEVDAEDADAKVAELQDQLLRAAAETENVRRRAARDVTNAHKFALEKFTSELLPVLDSLEKAVEAGSEAGDEANAALTQGVELSLKLFLAVLEKSGVGQLDPLGEPFDPQVHEAIAMVPNPDSEPNSVMEVMQRGYTLNGRLVRAAKVIVVSAPDR